MVWSRLAMGIVTVLVVLTPATSTWADDDDEYWANFLRDFGNQLQENLHRQNMEQLERERLYNEQLRLYYEQQRYYQQQQRPIRCWTQYYGKSAQTVCR